MLGLLWVPYSLSAALSAMGLTIRSLPKGKVSTPVNIVLTSIGHERLADSISNVIDHAKKVANAKVYLLTEPCASDNVLAYAKERGVETVVVPPSWDKGVAKGRAIWYFATHFAKADEWYMFLDDDSFPMDNTFTYDVTEADRAGRFLGNCVIVPRKGRSTLAHLCDNLRYTDDVTIFRLSLNGWGKPAVGMHGEGMLVKGHVLTEYWKDIHSIVEDAEFGVRTISGVRTFQSRTEISILSPHSVLDFWKQRRRWYLGLWSILNKFPLRWRAFVFLRMIAWSIGWLALANWILIPYLLATHRYQWEWSALGIISAVGFGLLGSYFLVGARKTRTLMEATALFPIYTTIESLMPIYALATIRRKGFEVIDK